MTNPVVIDAEPGGVYADITREFDASVDAVFRAHADPELLVRWIGPRSLTTTVSAWDFRDGGNYAFDQYDPAGDVYRFRGVFHTVSQSRLIIQTFEYLGAPDEVSLDHVRFNALPAGRCRLVSRSVFPSAEALEQMVSAGMEYGLTEGYEKLDELVTGG